MPTAFFMLFGNNQILNMQTMFLSIITNKPRKIFSEFSEIVPVIFFWIQCYRQKPFPFITQCQFIDIVPRPYQIVLQFLLVDCVLFGRRFPVLTDSFLPYLITVCQFFPLSVVVF